MTDSTAFRGLRRQILKASLVICTAVAPVGFIVATILAFLSGIALVLAPMSGSWSGNGATNLRFVLVTLTHVTLPIAILVGIIGGWRSFSLNHERTAWMLLLSPLLWVLALYLLY